MFLKNNNVYLQHLKVQLSILYMCVDIKRKILSQYKITKRMLLLRKDSVVIILHMCYVLWRRDISRDIVCISMQKYSPPQMFGHALIHL